VVKDYLLSIMESKDDVIAAVDEVVVDMEEGKRYDVVVVRLC
jgi:hypothetical protein